MDMMNLCIEMCTQIVAGCVRTPVFQVLHVPSYLNRLAQLLDADSEVCSDECDISLRNFFMLHVCSIT